MVGRCFAAIAEGRSWQSGAAGFFATGTRPIVVLDTREGYRLRLTRDHRLRRVSRRTRWSCDWEWCDAGALDPGDEVLIHNHRATPAWGDPARSAHDTAEGYLLGLLLGDGTFKKDKALLAVWTGQS